MISPLGTAEPTRPKDATNRAALLDDDRVLVDGSAGVGSILFPTLKNQLLGNITGALTFKGVQAGASVPNTSAAIGDYFIIYTAGSSQGKSWQIGDLAIYKGTTGQWEQVIGPRRMFNPMDFGAGGAGSTDDTTAVTAAFAAATAASGEVLLPREKTFRVAATYTLGNGMGVSGGGKLIAGAEYSPMIRVLGQNVTIKNITCDGNGQNVLRAVQVEATSKRVTIKHNTFLSLKQKLGDTTVPAAIRIAGDVETLKILYNTIDGVTALENGMAKGIVVSKIGGTEAAPRDILIQGNSILNITDIREADGICVFNDWNTNIYLRAQFNYFKGCAKRAIKFMEKGCHAHKNDIDGAGFAAISIYNSDCSATENTGKNLYGDTMIEVGGSILLSHVLVEGNILSKASDADVTTTGDGISVAGSLAHSHIIIRNNQIEHVRNGVRVNAPGAHISVEGNKIKDTTSAGVLVDGAASYVSANFNDFESVATYGVRFIAGTNVQAIGNYGVTNFEMVLFASGVLPTASGWGNTGTKAGLGNIVRDGISFPIPTAPKTGNYSVADSDYTVTVDCTGAARTMNLPSAVGHQGRIYVFKKIDASANAMILDGNGSETIDGQLTISKTTQWDTVRIQSDGANWFII
jgi:hypothetical protein